MTMAEELAIERSRADQLELELTVINQALVGSFEHVRNGWLNPHNGTHTQ